MPKPIIKTSHLLMDDNQYNILFKKVKNISISIDTKTLIIKLTVPSNFSLQESKKILLSKQNWIIKHLEKISSQVQLSKASYFEGEVIDILGESYVINQIPTSKKAFWIIPDNQLPNAPKILHLHCNPDSTHLQIQTALDYSIKTILQTQIQLIVTSFEPIMNVKCSRIKIQKMKTKWGTCNTRTRVIKLNSCLAYKPIECLRNVVVHELTHLLEKSHNKVFWDYMDKFLPNHRTTHKLLK